MIPRFSRCLPDGRDEAIVVMIGKSHVRVKCASNSACILAALSLVLFSTCAWPQTQLATVFGIITDRTGAVISGALVTVVNQSTGLKREVLTDLVGQYRIVGLPTGSYSARAQKEGFQTQVREELALNSISEFMMNLSLTVGDLKQEITVSADLPTIDNSTSTVSGFLPERSLTELPL